ncbi:MAG: hypothetical protein ABSF99_08490 [Anaerolineales bacterium]|jgi:hypothetical protein
MLSNPVFSISRVRELRGSPLTILVAIILLEQSNQVPVTAQLLQDVTGYGEHTITDSLRALTSPTRQIVIRVAGGWRIAQGFQMPLEIQNREKCDFEPQNREIRGFGASSSSCSLTINNIKDSEEQEERISENREFRGFDIFRENHELAIKLGIADPKASQLAGMPSVTPELIQAHVDQVISEGRPLGTAIYRLMHGWAPRVDKKSKQSKIEIQTAELTGHKPGCDCTDCQMSRAGVPVCPTCHHVYQNCECAETEP